MAWLTGLTNVSAPKIMSYTGKNDDWVPVSQNGRYLFILPNSYHVWGSKLRSYSVGNVIRASRDSNAKFQGPGAADEEPFSVLVATRSNYNDIVIVDTPKSRMLLLDSTRSTQSSSYPGNDNLKRF